MGFWLKLSALVVVLALKNLLAFLCQWRTLFGTLVMNSTDPLSPCVLASPHVYPFTYTFFYQESSFPWLRWWVDNHFSLVLDLAFDAYVVSSRSNKKCLIFCCDCIYAFQSVCAISALKRPFLFFIWQYHMPIRCGFSCFVCWWVDIALSYSGNCSISGAVFRTLGTRVVHLNTLLELLYLQTVRNSNRFEGGSRDTRDEFFSILTAIIGTFLGRIWPLL